MTIHVVQSGESVDSIAASYGVDPARLAADNAVSTSGSLAVGQTLVIRFPRQVHAVRAGETLSSIAAAYGISSLTVNDEDKLDETLDQFLGAKGCCLLICEVHPDVGTND